MATSTVTVSYTHLIADPLADIESQALERIKDRVNELEWDDMQQLVAGILRAMGYKTQVSPPGSDRGKDIVASPDGFGFEHPRIVVEVKHRKGQMGSQEIRSFLGGRHKMCIRDSIIAGRDSLQDTVNQIGQEVTRRNLNIQPTLTIRPGMPVRIVIGRDLVLRPYQPLFFNKGTSR